MANPQLLSGARGLIYKDDTVLAFATDITVTSRHGVRQTYVMGRYNPAVIDSLTYDVDVSIGQVVPVNASDAAFDPQGSPQVDPRSASATPFAQGLEPLIASFGSSEDLTISIQDRVTGQFIHAVRGCRFAGRSMGTNANDVAGARLNFIGIFDSGVEGENAASLLGYEGE